MLSLAIFSLLIISSSATCKNDLPYTQCFNRYCVESANVESCIATYCGTCEGAPTPVPTPKPTPKPITDEPTESPTCPPLEVDCDEYAAYDCCVANDLCTFTLKPVGQCGYCQESNDYESCAEQYDCIICEDVTTTESPTPKPTTTTSEPTPKPTTTTSEPTPKPTTTTSEPTPKPTTTTSEPTPKPTSTAEPTPKPTTTTSEPTPKPTSTSEPTPKPTTTTSEPTPKPTTSTTSEPTSTTSSSEGTTPSPTAKPTLKSAMKWEMIHPAYKGGDGELLWHVYYGDFSDDDRFDSFRKNEKWNAEEIRPIIESDVKFSRFTEESQKFDEQQSSVISDVTSTAYGPWMLAVAAMAISMIICYVLCAPSAGKSEYKPLLDEDKETYCQ